MSIARAAVIVIVIAMAWMSFFPSGETAPTPKTGEIIPPTASTDSPNQRRTNVPPTGIQGYKAAGLVAEQKDKMRQLMEVIRKASTRGDLSTAISALRIRRGELARALAEIETGEYSLSDKVAMLNPIQQEANWVDESLQGLLLEEQTQGR
jgi:hypothetical protein